jgi:phytoene synthase
VAETPDQLARIESLIGGDRVDLASSLARCRRITAGAGSSFGVGIRLTPARCRDSMHAIYAWMRLADDAADATAPVETRARVLECFERLTERALAGEAEGSIWPAFAHAARANGLDASWFASFLEGMRADLGPVRLESDADLDTYCDRVAGNVGRCCVAIWGLRRGVHAEKAYELAGLRGRALQRINIARDLDEDARAGRCYVPRALTERLGAQPTDRAVRSALLREAADQLEASAALDGMVRRDAGPALWAMTRAYRLIARRLDEPGVASSLGGTAKLGIAAGAIGRRVLAVGRLA